MPKGVRKSSLDKLPKQSKPTDLIQWVAANLDGEVDLKGCPGRDAYALLQDCIKTPSFRLDFWKTMYTKVLPSRAQLNDLDEGSELDGETTIKVLDKILKISEASKSKEGTGCEES